MQIPDVKSNVNVRFSHLIGESKSYCLIGRSDIKECYNQPLVRS